MIRSSIISAPICTLWDTTISALRLGLDHIFLRHGLIRFYLRTPETLSRTSDEARVGLVMVFLRRLPHHKAFILILIYILVGNFDVCATTDYY